MSRKRMTSLEAKTTTIVAGVIFALLLGITHIVMMSWEQALYEAKIQQFNNTAQALALAAGPLSDADSNKFRSDLENRLRSGRWEMAYIILADDSDNILYAGSKSKTSIDDVTGKVKWRVVNQLKRQGHINLDNTYSVTVPIRLLENRWGSFNVGFSLHELREVQQDVRSLLLFTFAGAMLLGVVSAVTFGRSLASSIRRLVKGVRAVAQGDFSYRVSSRPNDEVGELIDAYNYMIKALRRNHEQLTERANADSLTGLYNHRYFQERFTAEFARASRYEHPLSLLMVDVDRFKAFNDEHGHPRGDDVLRDIATILIESLREMDIPARYGGEEFVVMLPETSAAEAGKIAERLRRTIERHQFHGMDNRIVPVTVSIGVASYPEHSESKDQLLRAADVALYKAKSDGRNAVRSYSNEMPSAPLPDPCKLYVLLHANDIKTVEVLADAIDAKHRLSHGYSMNLAASASELAGSLGMSEDERAAIYLAALLRDVGQIAVPDDVLSKTEPLSEDERAVIEQHPVLGHSIIQKSSYFQSVLPAVLHHHERFDGTGYPYGLGGKDIPIAARIISVIDAYQSMISSRPHRSQLRPAEAQMELVKHAGTQFDPEIVDAFTRFLASKHKAA